MKNLISQWASASVVYDIPLMLVQLMQQDFGNSLKTVLFVIVRFHFPSNLQQYKSVKPTEWYCTEPQINQVPLYCETTWLNIDKRNSNSYTSGISLVKEAHQLIGSNTKIKMDEMGKLYALES